MTNTSIALGEAELVIMKALWQAKEPVNTPYINAAVAGRGWKRTTVSTFLTRLTDKGAVTCEKRGNQYYYAPALSEEEYRSSRTGRLIADLYGGSARELAAALFTGGKLSEEDIRELRAIIDGKER